MAFVNERENQRTIDYERDARLVHKGTAVHPNSPAYATFAFSWGNNQIEFGANEVIKRQPDGKANIEWEIIYLNSDGHSQYKREDITKLLEEALIAYGYRYQRQDVLGVKVKFSVSFGNMAKA